MKNVSLAIYQKKVPFHVITCNSCSTSIELESEEEIIINPQDYMKAFVTCPECGHNIQQTFNTVKVMEQFFSARKTRH